MPKPSALTAGTLIDGARMYAAAADAVNDRFPNSLHVLSHTLGMAIELALKAFLVNAGRSKQDLRKLGHDLPALLKEAEGLGLTKTGSRHFRLRVLGVNYGERIFAYPEEGQLNVILPASLREIAHEIICEVFVAVKGQALFGELQGEAGLSIQSDYPRDLAESWDAAPETTKKPTE